MLGWLLGGEAPVGNERGNERESEGSRRHAQHCVPTGCGAKETAPGDVAGGRTCLSGRLACQGRHLVC